jgi:hypothetical protein
MVIFNGIRPGAPALSRLRFEVHSPRLMENYSGRPGSALAALLAATALSRFGVRPDGYFGFTTL